MWRLIVCGRFGISHPRQVLEEWTQEQVTEAHRALDFQLELEAPAESPPDEE